MERLSILYASALFSLAIEQGSVDEFEEQAIFIRDALLDGDCLRIIIHPHVAEAEKREFLNNAFAAHINRYMLGFLFLVIEKNRETYLMPALAALIGKIRHYKGKVTANASFATQPDEKQVAEVVGILSSKLDKTVEVSVKVDPSLIGGPFIFVDGYYMDWTVRTRLNELTYNIKESSF